MRETFSRRSSRRPPPQRFAAGLKRARRGSPTPLKPRTCSARVSDPAETPNLLGAGLRPRRNSEPARRGSPTPLKPRTCSARVSDPAETPNLLGAGLPPRRNSEPARRGSPTPPKPLTEGLHPRLSPPAFRPNEEAKHNLLRFNGPDVRDVGDGTFRPRARPHYVLHSMTNRMTKERRLRFAAQLPGNTLLSCRTTQLAE